MVDTIIQFTKAQIADLSILQSWRNDPVTRSLSRRRHEFSVEDVESWVFNEGRAFYIAHAGGERVGFVSYEPHAGSDALEISIVVAPQFRGKGIGKMMLSEAVNKASVPLYAHVRKNNPMSIALFKSCGFTEISSDIEYIEFISN